MRCPPDLDGDIFWTTTLVLHDEMRTTGVETAELLLLGNRGELGVENYGISGLVREHHSRGGGTLYRTAQCLSTNDRKWGSHE